MESVCASEDVIESDPSRDGPGKALVPVKPLVIDAGTGKPIGKMARQKHLRTEALGLYVSLDPENRSTRVVARTLGVPLRTVDYWAAKDRWKSQVVVRVNQEDARAIDKIGEPVGLEKPEDIHDVKKALAAGIRALIKEYFKIDPATEEVVLVNSGKREVFLKDMKNFREAYNLYRELAEPGRVDPGEDGSAISATLVIKRG